MPDSLWCKTGLAEPASTPVGRAGDASVFVRWHGNVWPRLTVILADGIEASMLKTETIGNTIITTLTR